MKRNDFGTPIPNAHRQCERPPGAAEAYVREVAAANARMKADHAAECRRRWTDADRLLRRALPLVTTAGRVHRDAEVLAADIAKHLEDR